MNGRACLKPQVTLLRSAKVTCSFPGLAMKLLQTRSNRFGSDKITLLSYRRWTRTLVLRMMFDLSVTGNRC
jgi:hypothetical protein